LHKATDHHAYKYQNKMAQGELLMTSKLSAMRIRSVAMKTSSFTSWISS